MTPTNDAPNPYQTIAGWAKLPEGRTWGSTSAVDIDKDGVSVWVGERCGQNNCAGSNLPSILKFDANGNLVKSFGAGLIAWPHGIHVDREGNVWVTDARDNRPARGRGAAADAAATAAAGRRVRTPGTQVQPGRPAAHDARHERRRPGLAVLLAA